MAGFHSLNYGMFELHLILEIEVWVLTQNFSKQNLVLKTMDILQLVTKEVGTGYFDMVSEAASGGYSSTKALDDSTEADQF